MKAINFKFNLTVTAEMPDLQKNLGSQIDQKVFIDNETLKTDYWLSDNPLKEKLSEPSKIDFVYLLLKTCAKEAKPFINGIYGDYGTQEDQLNCLDRIKITSATFTEIK